MTPHPYDAIVVGLGGMGSAAAYHLARRGQRVLGLDAHPRGHALGSSHGSSRIIREAYYESPDYVPLVQRAYALWRELEGACGRQLLHITGGINVGRRDSTVVRGVMASARRHGLGCELLTARETADRFPGFRLTDDLVGVYQPNSGFLEPEACTAAHLDLAARHGADLRYQEPVLRWSGGGGDDGGSGVRVETGRGAYTAGKLVITAGPWASELLVGLGLPLAVQRIVNVYFDPVRPEWFTPQRCPVFGWLVPEGQYYGVPVLPGQGLKVGRHDAGEPCTAHTIRREIANYEVETLRQVLDRYMPGAAGAVRGALTCMYTHTPDRHFVIDRYPGQPGVSFACGFSGHGFKFASLVGEVLADLALEGRTAQSIGFLSSRRFETRMEATPAAAT